MKFMKEGKCICDLWRSILIVLYSIDRYNSQWEMVVDASGTEERVSLTNFTLYYSLTKYFINIFSASLKKDSGKALNIILTLLSL